MNSFTRWLNGKESRNERIRMHLVVLTSSHALVQVHLHVVEKIVTSHCFVKPMYMYICTHNLFMYVYIIILDYIHFVSIKACVILLWVCVHWSEGGSYGYWSVVWVWLCTCGALLGFAFCSLQHDKEGLDALLVDSPPLCPPRRFCGSSSSNQEALYVYTCDGLINSYIQLRRVCSSSCACVYIHCTFK